MTVCCIWVDRSIISKIHMLMIDMCHWLISDWCFNIGQIFISVTCVLHVGHCIIFIPETSISAFICYMQSVALFVCLFVLWVFTGHMLSNWLGLLNLPVFHLFAGVFLTCSVLSFLSHSHFFTKHANIWLPKCLSLKNGIQYMRERRAFVTRPLFLSKYKSSMCGRE